MRYVELKVVNAPVRKRTLKMGNILIDYSFIKIFNENLRRNLDKQKILFSNNSLLMEEFIAIAWK